MKKTISIALLVLIATSGFSQTKKSKKDAATTVAPAAAVAAVPTDATAAAVKTAPPLTEDQKKQIKEINKDFKSSKAKIEADATLSADQKKSQIKELSKAKSTKIKGMVTPEQYQEIKASHKEKNKE
ncbi:MAG: hypothetical protein WCH52_03025 [Bacteroidota bacterium]